LLAIKRGPAPFRGGGGGVFFERKGWQPRLKRTSPKSGKRETLFAGDRKASFKTWRGNGILAGGKRRRRHGPNCKTQPHNNTLPPAKEKKVRPSQESKKKKRDECYLVWKKRKKKKGRFGTSWVPGGEKREGVGAPFLCFWAVAEKGEDGTGGLLGREKSRSNSSPKMGGPRFQNPWGGERGGTPSLSGAGPKSFLPEWEEKLAGPQFLSPDLGEEGGKDEKAPSPPSWGKG